MNKKIIGLLWVGAVLSGGGCVMSTPEAKNTVVTPKTHMATKPKVARQPKYKSVADKITQLNCSTHHNHRIAPPI